MNAILRISLLALIGLGLPLAAQAGTADAGAQIVQQQCAACHALQAPDYTARGIQERIERKAPLLHYAGNKFQRAWLVAWLQKPARIRPAGAFPAAHTRATADGDVIDPGSLAPHPVLPAAEAEQVADYLLTLRPFDALIQAETYQPGSISLSLGQMNFGKFKGCDACHQDEAGYGGISGPELYTAWQRLQPAFISSYIGNPLAWDPHTMMPRTGMNSDEVHKLANYLKAIAEGQP